MAWIYLILAGVFEVVWARGLKYPHGFTRSVLSLITLGGMLISFYLLSLATKSLPIGTTPAHKSEPIIFAKDIVYSIKS